MLVLTIAAVAQTAIALRPTVRRVCESMGPLSSKQETSGQLHGARAADGGGDPSRRAGSVRGKGGRWVREDRRIQRVVDLPPHFETPNRAERQRPREREIELRL